METLLTLAWTLLLGAVARLLTGFYLYLLPLQYLIAAAMVAWLESPESAHRTNPLSAFGLVEASSGGRSATQWQTLLRILFTPPFLLAGLVGFLPLLSGRRSLPEVFSGTRIVPLNPALDPRSPVAIRRAESRIRVVVRFYTVFSLAIAALVLLVPVRFESILDRPVVIQRETGIPESDEQLLAIYLDLSARNPDVVEFHVRLASLYYRNGMTADLRQELEEVRRLDPAHAILILLEDQGEGPGSLFGGPDSASAAVLQNLAQPAAPPDTAGDEGDSLSAQQDSLAGAADSLAGAADSLVAAEDSLASPGTYPDPYAGTLIPDTLEAPDVPDTSFTEQEDSTGEDGYLPDTLELPETEPVPMEIVPGEMPVIAEEDGDEAAAGEQPPAGQDGPGEEPGTPE
jgi:hypothetical protein